MSCPKKEVELILGCRNGVAVYKREKFLSDGTYDSSSDEYSDGLGSLGRTPGECQAAISQKDPEIVCMTNDGGETVVKGVVIFSYDGTNWTSTVNNLDGSVATGYTVIPCATANQVEEGEVRCDGGINIVPFYDVETDGAASANVAFWFNPVANAIVVPSGSQTPGACAISKIVQVPNCAGTLDDKSVDSITATYLLNQENKHTEVISDVLTAVFGGTVAFTYTAPTNVAISYAGVTLANDTIVGYRTDFGDGYNDVGPSPDHSYNADGAYEIKGYAITLSGNKVLLYAKEVTIASGVITYSGANPHTVARTYKVLVAKAFQDYCGTTLVGTPYDANGGAYTLVGDFEIATPIIIDELEDNADYQAKDTTLTNTVQTSTILQLDAFGTIVGPVLRLDRVYDNTGALVSETYYDTVTGLPATLSPSTTQIIDAHGLDTEIIELCDDNGTFLRHIGHAPGGQPISQRDTTVDGMTAYTTVGAVIKCTDCKKEIFATHIKWLNVPAVAYEMSTTVAATYGGANDATNTYIHLIYPIQSGNPLTPIGPQLTEYFSNPQNGVLFTDVATVQAMTDNALLQMGLSVGDAIYAVNTDNEPIWILSPAAEAELANGTYLHIYYGTVDTHNSYDQKADVNIIATNPNILLGGAGTGSCTAIQEIKEKDSCTGLETYRYIIEDGAGNLVPVTDVFPAFVEADVLHEPCPATAIVETAGGILVTTGNTFNIPANAVSFTVTAQTGSFDVSFDGGTTYALTNRKGSRTRGQGTIEVISNSSNITILSNGDVDIIRETI